jgi:hypothetical protein
MDNGTIEWVFTLITNGNIPFDWRRLPSNEIYPHEISKVANHVEDKSILIDSIMNYRILLLKVVMHHYVRT